jgi:hypothetical protein
MSCKNAKYLVFDGINSDYQEFETLKQAQEYLEEIFLDANEGYHPETTNCKIYILSQLIKIDVVDSKENYEYENEEDIPEGDNISEAWPYDNAFDEIWKHNFIDYKLKP